MEYESSGIFVLVCAVFDEKVKAFLAPFTCKTRGEAVRSFADAVRNPDHGFHKHPEDFSLHLLAKFDEEKGTFENVPPAPEMLVLALSCVEPDDINRRPVGVR